MANRKAMGFLMDEMGLSERRNCRIVRLRRSVRQYRPVPGNDHAVIERMKELASENRWYGYLHLHALLRHEGLVVNHKCTLRLFVEQGLQVPPRSVASCPDATGSLRRCQIGQCKVTINTTSGVKALLRGGPVRARLWPISCPRKGNPGACKSPRHLRPAWCWHRECRPTDSLWCRPASGSRTTDSRS